VVDVSVAGVGNALLGGALVGLAASLLLALNGKVAGVSGIVSGLVRPESGEWGWRAAFVLGLLGGGTLFAVFRPEVLAPARGAPWLMGAAGLLVGFGTRLGGGCTSGHGVCGLSRLSGRALVGTVTFMITGMATVAVAHQLGVGP
jgi:hypothetical protein